MHLTVLLLISCTALICCNTNYYKSYTANPIYNAATYDPSNDIGYPTKRKLIQSVTTLHNGNEINVAMKISPTHVIRSIAAQLIQWRICCVVIVTENIFDIIARQWQEFLLSFEHIARIALIVLRDDWMAENLKQDIDECLNIATVVLLRSHKLNILFRNQTLAYLKIRDISINRNRFIIIGSCPPNFISRHSIDEKLHITVLRVNTGKWVQGILNKESVCTHSIHLIKENVWTTFPLKSIQKDNLLKSSTHPLVKQYGLWKNITIHATIHTQPGIIEFNNEELRGLLGIIVQYMKSYLKFNISAEIFQPQDVYSFLHSPPETSDLNIGGFMIAHDLMLGYLPAIFFDGVSIFTVKLDRPANIATLFSTFTLGVWALLLVIIVMCNFCFSLTFHASPSLKNHPRVKNKSYPVFLKIVCFDSLIAFQMEWEKGPTLSSRWLLFTFNFLFFFASTVYLIIFSAKVLADKTYFPFHDLSELCKINMHRRTILTDAVTLHNQPHCHSNCIVSDTYKLSTEPLEDMENGTWIGIMSTLAGTYHFKHAPHVHKFSTAACHREMSIKIHTDFQFSDTFSEIIHRLREAGILKILYIRHTQHLEKDDTLIRAMSLSETWFIFAICGIGIFVAFLIVCVERFAKNKLDN